MTLVKTSIITILLIASNNHIAYAETLISLKDAKKQFAHQPAKLQAAKLAVQDYYEPAKKIDYSQYEQEVRDVCQNALDTHFKKHMITEQSAIIFDIDETALSDYPFFKAQSFEWSIEDAYQFRFTKESVAIRPVQEFYNELKKLGFKLIFLTSRRDTLYQATCQNLAQEGYVFDELILLPIELFNQHVPHGAWKAEERKKLAQKYDIVGSVGDSLSDFEGDYCGIKVKLPNYLY